MVKEEIIKKIALLSKDQPKEEIVTQKQTRFVLETLADVIADELHELYVKSKKGKTKGNDKINLQGIGVFSVSKRKAHIGKHPQTGEPMKFDESYGVHFRPSQELRDALS